MTTSISRSTRFSPRWPSSQISPFRRLLSLSVNLAVRLISSRKTDEAPRLAVVQVPGGLPGLCRLPHGEELELCWLADVIRRRLSGLFPGLPDSRDRRIQAHPRFRTGAG